jgi:hypothetical protein
MSHFMTRAHGDRLHLQPVPRVAQIVDLPFVGLACSFVVGAEMKSLEVRSSQWIAETQQSRNASWQFLTSSSVSGCLTM